MKKTTLDSYKLALPDIIKTVGDYFKEIVSKESVDTLSSSTGTLATLVKVFATPVINRIYKDIGDKQLKNYGFDVYLNTAIEFSNSCLTDLLEEQNISYTHQLSNTLSGRTLSSIVGDQIQITNLNVAVIFSPKYHPAVEFIKNVYTSVLEDLKLETDISNKFLKSFNQGISEKIKERFGDNYEKHLKEVHADHLTEKSVELLNDIIQISRIGFDEKEKIEYVETYGSWVEIHHLENSYQLPTNKKQIDEEAKLILVKELINQYFNQDIETTIEKILFLVADFGKGKSVFLKHYAAELAKSYIANSDGYFPIYFNLRDFGKYQADSKHGIIYDYIETRYGIKLDDQHFKINKYVFLVDSLDESGELVKAKIEKVISSVKRIQNIDKEVCRQNRIIITTRPFDDGLKNQLLSHSPFLIKSEDKRQVPFFISLHGFKKDQLNKWLSGLLKDNEWFMNNAKGGYSQKIIQELKRQEVFDIHETLTNESTLSYEELKRPIFGYMIYQLLINDYDFLKAGKIGVYLSFINLLSKEAKYIHDKNYSFSLVEQFESRNILHTIASLWVNQRSSGNQGSLKKADICRAIAVDNLDVNDDKVLEKYKGAGINEISFLSHSYFGENNNVLHFQHQSFAEILLAEYYLKILIKFSLDRTPNINMARRKLFVGQPSTQTMEFFKALLLIFKDTCTSTINAEILEKRKLLFPFIASIATEKYNKELLSENLFFNWFQKYNWNTAISEAPSELLEKWFFDEEHLDKITQFCREIVEDQSYELLLSKSNRETAIFNDELTKLKGDELTIRNIDKLLSSFAGCILVNDSKNNNFFMQEISESSTREMIAGLMRNGSNILPIFKAECLKGIILDGNDFLDWQYFDCSNADFSYSVIKNIYFTNANLYNMNFSNVTFDNVDFSNTTFLNTNFNNCKFLNYSNFALVRIAQGTFFPYELAYKIYQKRSKKFTKEKPSSTDMRFTGIFVSFGAHKTYLDVGIVDDLTRFKSFKQIIYYFVNEKILTYTEVVESFILTGLNAESKLAFKQKFLEFLIK